jgi:hypothetical protein
MVPTKPILPAEPPAPRARFLRDARGIPADEVVPLRTDPLLAEKNVAAGVAAVLAYDAHVAEHLHSVDLGELRSLPDLARAVVDAARDVGLEEGELRPLLAEALSLSRTLRASAEALVEGGVLSPRDLARLSPARGAADPGGDCAALASVFQRRAEDVAGKTPVTEDEVARAAEIGASLRALWKPKGPARKAGADGLSPAEARDRLWTLLVLRHERLWAVAAYVYGHAADAQVPPLHAPVAEKGTRARGRAARPAASAVFPSTAARASSGRSIAAMRRISRSQA